MNYVYHFVDGTTYEIELADNWLEVLEVLDRKEKLNNRRETRRHQSLERLLELDGFFIESKEPGPLEILLEWEYMRIRHVVLRCPTFTNKQRQAMILFHVYGFSRVQIAKRLGCNESVVRRRIDSGNKKVLKYLGLK